MHSNSNSSNQTPNTTYISALNNAQFNLSQQQPQQQTQTSIFATSNTIPQQQKPLQQTGMFGGPQQQQPSIGLFGTYEKSQQPGLFGLPQQPQQPNPFIFPQQPQQPQQPQKPQQPQQSIYFGISQPPQYPGLFGNSQPISSSSNSSFNFNQVPQQQVQASIFQSYGNVYPPTNLSYFSATNYESKYSQKLQKLSFADDDLLPQSAKVVQKKLKVTLCESKIDFTLASEFQQIRLGSNVTLPSLCSITGVGGNRASVDVICLIDQSGSMSGQKIALVRDTMKYVLKMLTPKDRLSIAVYENDGTRLCPFKFVNKDNMRSLEDIVNKLRAGGGNIMLNGLQVAVKMLRERRNRNQVTSIFLLSDGQEPTDTDLKFKQMLEKQQNKDIGSFSLHSFGFGNDHDENLMTKVCSLKDGNFYFINKLSTLDEAFCNALGGIITQTATDIEINVECIAPAPFEGITIQKVYGNKWQKVNDKKYSITINQIMSQVSKDFVFQLNIPKTVFKPLDANRSLQVLQATYTAKDTITGSKLQGSAKLKLQFLDENAVFKRQSNPIVIEPYYRLIAVQTMNDSIKLAEQGNFDQARKKIDDILETIKYHPNIRKDKVKGLIEDLEFAKQKCTRQVFQTEGRKQMVNLCYANTNNCSYQFSNVCQQQMLYDLKQAKKS